ARHPAGGRGVLWRAGRGASAAGGRGGAGHWNGLDPGGRQCSATTRGGRGPAQPGDRARARGGGRRNRELAAAARALPLKRRQGMEIESNSAASTDVAPPARLTVGERVEGFLAE